MSAALDAGTLPFGGGLLALLRPALDAVGPGGVVALHARDPGVEGALAAWCRQQHHALLSVERLEPGAPADGRARGDGGAAPDVRRFLVRRGPLSVPRWPHGGAPARAPAAGAEAWAADAGASAPGEPGAGGPTVAAGVRAEPFPERAEPATGFAPRGARVEPGSLALGFSLVERARVAPPDVALLYDQAIAARWDARTDIPWRTVRPLPPALERAVAQVMTFLAENELSALYVPAKFLPRIHPAYVETAMLLSAQLADEARHLEVFRERARRAGGGALSHAVTSASLGALLALEDFTEAMFLLSVLGEGTFVDLLRFVEQHAPDEATAELCRRARQDETRHVHHGLSHVRHALAHDAGLGARLEAAVARRAATLATAGGPPAAVQDALVVLAAGGLDPAALARGADAYRALEAAMHDGRARRLRSAGFDDDAAERLSALHTPNFM